MQDFFQILSNFGFPIALSCYLLFRFEKVLEGLQKAITDLVQKNTELVNKNSELVGAVGVLKESVTSLRNLLGRNKK